MIELGSMIVSSQINVNTQTGPALLNIAARGAGNPNDNGLQIFNPKGDSVLSLKTNPGQGNSGITFDWNGRQSWQMGNRDYENGTFVLANDWKDLSVNQRLKFYPDGRAQINATQLLACDVSGNNCKNLK